ncbi:hypothetical protein EYZ11_009141 [Aspergillus tanneri]|uniref:Arrestin C-terminal-like domain-containing protein n=1 Tax=Aspergillus tanneri TaxID=1220188 RepID=A0A4S3J913_9EURO|nr:hypothetical protein EYZ11_009141 [Aspergillus tanneri]
MTITLIKFMESLRETGDDIWLPTPALIENQWHEKVQYTVSIPDVNIPFGSTFPVEFWMAPMAKGLKLGAITIEVREKHNLKIAASAAYSAHCGVNFFTSAEEYTIFSERYDAGNYVMLGSELLNVEWRVEKTVCLPRGFEACTQSVDSKNINICHMLAFTIELHNENGSLSKIQGTFPINIFMSPRTISKNAVVHILDLQQFQADRNAGPPLYGNHIADLLLSENPHTYEYHAGGPTITPLDTSSVEYRELCSVPSYETAMNTTRAI